MRRLSFEEYERLSQGGGLVPVFLLVCLAGVQPRQFVRHGGLIR